MKMNSRLAISCLVLVVLAFATTAAPARAEDAPAAYQQSYDLEADSKLQESLAALERVPSAQQTYVYQYRRGWLLYLLGRHAEAVESYERAIAAAPSAIEPRLGVMLPQLALRRWLDVEKVAVEVLRRDPMNYLAGSRLAWAYYNLGRWADAAAMYRRVLVAYPSEVDMRAGLGWSLLKQGKAAEAAVELRQVLEVAPRHKTAKEGLQAAGVPR